MQLEILVLAISILASAIIAAWQLRESSKEIARAVERITATIHADIRASQEKLGRELRERRRARQSD